MADDLSTPLVRRSEKRRFNAGALIPRRWPFARLSFAAMALVLAVTVGRIVLTEEPEGGRPSAEAAISANRPQNSVVGEVAPKSDDGGPVTITPLATPEGGPSITTIDAASLPDAPSAGLEGEADGVFPDLLEETQHGAIPRIGAQGQTPFSAYSRASTTPAAAGGKPLVAIVVTGLGLNESGTLEAVDTLPDDVTLAFAPYGKSLPRTVAAARAQGHELLLQLPMEPFDYPENDPGPETLLTGQPMRANLEKLFWLMARFGGYAGVMNHMGARFTASAADFTPMMEEFGTRGLAYFDDGTSNRSLAPQLAETNKVPFAKGSLVLDNNPSRAPILAALDSLEAEARQTGSAIGVISGLPVSIQTVAEWAAGLEDKGLVLVPASALMTKR